MLRKVMPLAPILRNDTRWSSCYAMVERYYSVEPTLRALVHVTVAEYDLDFLLLSHRENERDFALRDDLSKMEGVTKALQVSTLTLSGVRRLFDHVLSADPQLKSRLGQTAAIINNVPLEYGVVRLQRQEPLTSAERAACVIFKLEDGEVPDSTDTADRPSFVHDAFKRRRVARRLRYLDVGFVPPTSNECPETLEAVRTLAINRDLWDVFSVERIRAELEPNARD